MKSASTSFGIYLQKRHRDPAQFDLVQLAETAAGYSGAEIEQAVISALYDAFDVEREVTTDDILVVVKQSVPLSMTMKETNRPAAALGRDSRSPGVIR